MDWYGLACSCPCLELGLLHHRMTQHGSCTVASPCARNIWPKRCGTPHPSPRQEVHFLCFEFPARVTLFFYITSRLLARPNANRRWRRFCFCFWRSCFFVVATQSGLYGAGVKGRGVGGGRDAIQSGVAGETRSHKRCFAPLRSFSTRERDLVLSNCCCRALPLWQ